MTTSVYTIHREINRPMLFNGFVEQYILYMAVGMVGDLLLFVLLYCCRVPPWFCIPFALLAGAANLLINLRLSQRYGVHGLMKKRARHRIPHCIQWKSRQLFLHLKP
jgi:Domain of unknown function (DUF4133)